MRAVSVLRLYSSIISTQKVKTSPLDKRTDSVLKLGDCDVALSSYEDLGLSHTRSVGTEEQPREKCFATVQVRRFGCYSIDRLVHPRECLCWLKIVPKTMAHDKCVGLLGFLLTQVSSELVQVFILDWILQKSVICNFLC